MYEDIFNNTPLFLTGVFVFGLLIGSFLNVVILRFPARLEHEWRGQCRELLELENDSSPAPPDIMFGRSRCPGCGHSIRSYENIPVLSWLFLRGKCSGCGQAISIRYPFVELLTALLFFGVALTFGASEQTLAALALTGFLVALSGIDVDHQLLPDQLTLSLLWLGLAINLFSVFTSIGDAVVGAIVGYLALWLIYHLFRLATGKEGMGYGDFKLLAAFGAWLGWQSLPLIILLSSLVGAVTGIVLLLLKRHQSDQPIPFGPFIAAAGWITLIWGDTLVNNYLRISGL